MTMSSASPTSSTTCYSQMPNDDDQTLHLQYWRPQSSISKETDHRPATMDRLSIEEIAQLRQLLQLQSIQPQCGAVATNRRPANQMAAEDAETAHGNAENSSIAGVETLSCSGGSHYDEFPETTHAWAIFADDPKQRTATRFDRTMGCLIMAFQLFTYFLFVKESIRDYRSGQVPVTVGHADCLAANQRPGYTTPNDGNNHKDDDTLEETIFQCEAGFTNVWDALVAFFMLGIFLTADFIRAARAILHAPTYIGLSFALLAGLEVSCSFLAASIAVSYHLYIGEVTDAVEVGIGLLFVRELSARAYHGIRQKRNKMQHMLTCCGGGGGGGGGGGSSHVRDPNSKIQQYKTFFATLLVLVILGFLINPLCEYIFAVPLQY